MINREGHFYTRFLAESAPDNDDKLANLFPLKPDYAFSTARIKEHRKKTLKNIHYTGTSFIFKIITTTSSIYLSEIS